MLVQLHFQNRSNQDETKFVAQGEFEGYAEFDKWAEDVRTRFDDQMPDGWRWMVLNDKHPKFMWAASEVNHAAT